MFKIIIEASVKQGLDPQSVRMQLAQLFKVPLEKFAKLFNDREFVFKHNITLEQAQKYLRVIENTGAQCRIEEEKDLKKTIKGENKSEVKKTNPYNTKNLHLEKDTETQKDSLSNELPVCPKCGYQAKSVDDPLVQAFESTGECPRCLVVVKKYLKQMERESLSEPVQDMADHSEQDFEEFSTQSNEPDFATYPPASVKRRMLATFHTGMRLCLICMLIAIPLNLLLAVDLVQDISSSSSSEIYSVIRDAKEPGKIIETVIYMIVIAFVLFYIPLRNGVTWGQKATGILVINKEGKLLESIGSLFLRNLGHFFAWFTLWVTLLVPLFHSKKKGVPDLLSKTQQIEDPTVEPDRGFFIFVLFVIVLIVYNLSLSGINGWMESTIVAKRNETKKKEVNIKSYQSIDPNTAIQQAEQARRKAESRIQKQREFILQGEQCAQGIQQACEAFHRELELRQK